MLNKFIKEKNNEKTKSSNHFPINNNSNQFNINQSALVKLTEEEQTKDLENNEKEINEIEKKLYFGNNLDLLSRENHISKEFEEVIEVPKKIIKDEVNLISEDIKQNQIKKEIIEKENKQDKEKRQKEIDVNTKRIEEYSKHIDIYNLKNKKKYILLFFKCLALILLITGFLK